MIHEILKEVFYGENDLQNEEKLIDLIKSGFDIESKDEDGFTFLMLACYFGFPNLVRIAIDNGADIFVQDNKGKTALHYSMLHMSKYFECIQHIKTKHEEINRNDKSVG